MKVKKLIVGVLLFAVLFGVMVFGVNRNDSAKAEYIPQETVSDPTNEELHAEAEEATEAILVAEEEPVTLEVEEEPETPYQRTYKQQVRKEFVEPVYGSGNVGDEGRFVLPEQEYAIPLWNGLQQDYLLDKAQYIVDAEDSAALFWLMTDTPIVADHAHQGFTVINNCQPGELAYIEKDGHKTWYECEYVDLYSMNYGYDLITSDGVNAVNAGADHLVTYTCNGTCSTIWYFGISMVVWRETEVEGNPFGCWVYYYPEGSPDEAF